MAGKPPSDRDLRALLRVCERFRRAAPWKLVHDGDPVAIRFADDDEPWFAVIMGAAGLEFGVHVMRGLDGLRLSRETDDLPDDDEQVRELQHGLVQMGFSTSRWSELPGDQQRRYQRAGINPRREATVPYAMCMERGQPWSIDARSLRRLVQATTAILDAQERGGLRMDERPEPCACLALDVGGPWREPDVSVTWHDYGVGWPEPELGGPDWVPPPPPPETAAWRAVEGIVIRDLVERMEDRGLVDDTSIAEYFGSVEEALPLLRERTDLLPSYYTWLIEHVRRPPGAPTVLESMSRDEDLGDDDLRVVEARLAARPTFARIETADPETGWVEVLDVLRGGGVRFHDWGLAKSTEVGIVFAVALARVDDVVLPTLLGPALPPLEADHAFAYLEELGVELTPEGLHAKAHLLGRLWAWQAERAEPALPTVRNVDGEPVEPHEMLLRADDPDAFLEALARRDDVEYDEVEGVWSWFRANDPEGDHGRLGDAVYLADIRVIADEILVSTNSAARADRARRWLEDLPGVRFERVRARSLGSLHDVPLDDRFDALLGDALLGGEHDDEDGVPSADALDAVLDRLYAYYLDWLDQPIPALDGRTPREAAATPDGRRRVLRLIRTLPPIGPGLDAGPRIRARLLRELGLDPDAD